MLAPQKLLEGNLCRIVRVTGTPSSTVTVGATKNCVLKVKIPTIDLYTPICLVGWYVDKTTLAVSRAELLNGYVWVTMRNASTTTTVDFGTVYVDILYMNNLIVSSSTSTTSLIKKSSSSDVTSATTSAIFGASA